MRVEYSDYEKMLNCLAWRAAKRTGMDFSEARSIANLAFMEAQQSWDENKGAFSTHLTYVFMREFYRNNRGRKWEEIPEDMIDNSSHPFEDADFKLRLSKLSDEAKEVIRVIFDSPVELFDWTVRTIKTTKTNLMKYLTEVVGWERHKVSKAFAEIQNAIND